MENKLKTFVFTYNVGFSEQVEVIKAYNYIEALEKFRDMHGTINCQYKIQ